MHARACGKVSFSTKFTVVARLDPSALLTAEQNFVNRFQTQVPFDLNVGKPIGLPDWLIL